MEGKQERDNRVITWAFFGLTVLRIGWFAFSDIGGDPGAGAALWFWRTERYYLFLMIVYLIAVLNTLRDIRKGRNQ